MATVFDVAEYILQKEGAMPGMKLQKLVYYAQAWSLVWDERAIFKSRIQAWANGPVVPELYKFHRREFEVRPGHFEQGNPKKLTQDERETVDAVLRFYGDKSSQWLSDLTHREAPWRDARIEAGLAPGERGDALITKASLAEYYGGISPG
jgi:uncharacterized phage-associated protein